MSMMWFPKDNFKVTLGKPRSSAEGAWLRRLQAVREQVEKVSVLLKPLDGYEGDLHKDTGHVVLDGQNPVVGDIIEELKHIMPGTQGFENAFGSLVFDPETGQVESLEFENEGAKISYSREEHWLRADREHFRWEQTQPSFQMDEFEWYRRPELHDQRPDTVMGDAFPTRHPYHESGLRVDMSINQRNDKVSFATSEWAFGMLLPC